MLIYFQSQIIGCFNVLFQNAVPQLRRSKSKEEVSLKVVRKSEPVCDKKSIPTSSMQSGPFDKRHPPPKKRKDDDKSTSNNEE